MICESDGDDGDDDDGADDDVDDDDGMAPAKLEETQTES